MKAPSSFALCLLLWGGLLIPLQAARAQAPPPTMVKAVTTPKEFLGFNIGDDYCLANYQQLKGYWEKLERESDRIHLVNIGATEEGRPQLAAIVTAPANHRERDRYQGMRSPPGTLRRGVDRAEEPGGWPPREERSCGSTPASTHHGDTCAHRR